MLPLLIAILFISSERPLRPVPADGGDRSIAQAAAARLAQPRTDWTHLDDVIAALEQARPEAVAKLLYEVRMAAAAANCRPASLPHHDWSGSAAAARTIYDRLSCRAGDPTLHRAAPTAPSQPDRERAAHRAAPTKDALMPEAIARAAAITGVRADFLFRTATVESGLRLDARSSTSSAQGLFQFLDGTWLTTVRRYGPALGLEAAAAEIDLDAGGRPYVRYSAARSQILALRSDALVSAALAAMLTRENALRLANAGRRSPSASDLYTAHLLGAGSATRLLAYAHTEPGRTAALLFPDQARANPALFFSARRARTIAELVQVLAERFGQ